MHGNTFYTITHKNQDKDGNNLKNKPSFYKQAADKAQAEKASSILGSYKSVSDFDIRKLMKLLIQAFSTLMSTQRQSDLNALEGIVNTLSTKLDAMEDAKKAQYQSTLTSAIGSIVAGSLSVGMAGVGALAGLGGTEKATPIYNNSSGTTEIIGSTKTLTNCGALSQFLLSSATPTGQTITGMFNIASAEYSADKAQAEIQQTTADAMLEVWRKAQDQGQKSTEALMQFITNLLNMMQQLQQSVSSTEKTIVQS